MLQSREAPPPHERTMIDSVLDTQVVSDACVRHQFLPVLCRLDPAGMAEASRALVTFN